MRASKKRARNHNYDTFTYCNGPAFVADKGLLITTNTIVGLIDALTEQFGEGYTFVPEAIVEGGIQMTSWPDKEPDVGYKTFRFHIQRRERWPWIGPDTLAEWRAPGHEQTIWSPPPGSDRTKFHIFLKAFHGAPCWTRECMTKVIAAFQSVGIAHVKSSVPTNKAMREVGELGKRIK